jgi:small basic protein
MNPEGELPVVDLDALSGGSTVLLASVVIGLMVRSLKDDTILPTVPAAYRRALAFLLGLVAAALQMMALGATWQVAMMTAVGAPLLAIVGHHLGVDVVRGGREIWIPGLMKKPKSP